jgi:hypothetical protein
MRGAASLLAAIGALATLGIGLDAMSRPYTLAAAGFIAWAVSPYMLLALLVRSAHTRAARVGVLLVTLLAVIFGVAIFVDAMYLHLDAQSALVFLFVPLWQWVGLLVLAVPLLLLSRVGRTGRH